MIMSVMAAAKTTLVLIGICILGVTGRINGVIVYQDVIAVHADIRPAFAYGGFIVSGTSSERFLSHEYGHLIQERKYGPLYELLVVVPSLVSALLSGSEEIHQSRWFEIEATELGRQ